MAEMFDSTYKPAVGARMTEQAICDICEDHKEEYHTTCCNTAYCHYCLDRLFEEATREVSHPAKCCARGTPIPVESVEAFLSEDTTQRYKKAVAEFQVPTRERTYCVSCGSFVPVSNTLTHSAACTSCKNSTCTLCKQGSHEGECSSTTADSEFREVARKNGWQQCPHCGHMIALIEGCDHMTCICGRDFCYICGKNDCGYRCRRPANELQNLILEMRDLSEQFHDDFDVLYGLFENLTNGLNAARFSAPAEMYPDARRMAELGRTLERMRAFPSQIRSHIELIHQAPVPAPMLHARTRQQSSPQEFLQQQQQQQQQQQRHQQQQRQQQQHQQQQRQQQQHQHRILQQMRQLQQERRVQQQLQQQIQEQLQERLLHEQSRGCGPFTESATAWQHSPYHPVQRPQNDPVSSAQHGFAWYDRRVAQEHLVSSPQYSATLASGPVMTSTPQTNESNSVTLNSSENASFPYHPDTQSVWHNRQFFNQPLARHRGFHEQSSPAPRSPPGELLLPPMV